MKISFIPHGHAPHRLLIVRVIVVVVVLFVLIAALSIVEQRRTQSETGAIVSAFLSDKVLPHTEVGSAGQQIQIIVARESKNLWDRETLPRRLLFDRESSFLQSSPTTRASFYLSNLFSTDVQTELHLSGGVHSFWFKWTELRGNDPKEFEMKFPNNFGYFVVSHPGLNLNKTEAILYVDHFCGGLCGGGGYFLMQKVNGVWHVVEEHVTWMS